MENSKSKGKGPKISAIQMMVLNNIGSCFTNCSSFANEFDQPSEVQMAIKNIRSGLNGAHKQEVTDIKNKMEEILEIVNKMKDPKNDQG